MSKKSNHSGELNADLIHHMLATRQYRLLYNYLSHTSIPKNQRMIDLLRLAQALLDVDLETVNQLAPTLQLDYLLRPTLLERRVYSFSHYLHLQFERQEYGDYFRGLTPVLVDVFRLIVERHIMPQLNEFLHPVIKKTAAGEPQYKGLQWNESRIEISDNIIHQTWQKYYGDNFNYDHYVSSSHIVKIVQDHAVDDQLVEKVVQMREVERFVRNLVAHEVVHIDEAFIQKRINLSPAEIQHLFADLLDLSGLKDQQQWDILHTIEDQVIESIQKLLKNK